MDDATRHLKTMIDARIAELKSAKANLEGFQTQVNKLETYCAALKRQNYVQYDYIPDNDNMDTDVDRGGPSELPPPPPNSLCNPPDYENILAAKDTGSDEDTDQLRQGEREYDCDSDVSSDNFEYEERRRKLIAEVVALYKEVGISQREIEACDVEGREREKINILLRRHMGLLERTMRRLVQLAFDVEEDDTLVNTALEVAMGGHVSLTGL